MPDLHAVKEAEAKVRKLYATEYADTTKKGKIALAKKLLDQGRMTSDDPPGKFVLLREARDLSKAMGDAEAAFVAIDCMGQSFPIDSLAMKIETLRAISGKKIDLSSQALEVIDLLLGKREYDSAVALLPLLNGKSADSSQVTRTREFLEFYIKAKSALKLIGTDQETPVVDTLAGKFYCFMEDDWAKGLPLLRKGIDEPLRKLAELEQANPPQPNAQMKLADAWWEWASKYPAPLRQSMLARAGHWYRQAMPNLNGLDKVLAEKRVEEITRPVLVQKEPPATQPSFPRSVIPQDAVRLGSHAYKFFPDKHNWQKARKFCEEMGGHLACISGKEENALVAKLVAGQPAWLGGMRDAEGKGWTWITGEKFSYTNWAPRQPNGKKGKEYYLLLWRDGQWNDSTGSAGYICEWE